MSQFEQDFPQPTPELPTRTRPPRTVGWIIALAVFLPVAFTTTFLVPLVVWPGQIKLVAPLFCDENQPDAFVVSDTYSTGPGETTTNFTLYCMGPNGDATDHGYLWPFLAAMAINVAVILVLVIVFWLIRSIRRRRRRGGADGEPEIDPRLLGPATTSGPFVD